MKRVMIVLAVLFVFTISAFAEMSTGQGGGMMGGGWGWGYELRMVFYDHYRDSRYFWHRLFDETKVNP